MNKILRLSVVSVLNAFILYLLFLPMANFYRIQRITGWSGDTVNGIINTFGFILFIVSCVTLFFLIRRFLKEGYYKYWLSIAWIPFYIVMIMLNAWLIPITEPGESPAPVTGLLLIFSWILYPFYILLITATVDTVTTKE